MKKFDLGILDNADDDIIEKLPPFSSDEETRKRVLSMSEKKFDELMNKKKDEKYDEYSVSVSGVEKYNKPVWNRVLCTAAAFAVIAGGLGTAAFLNNRSKISQDDITAAQSEMESTTAEEQVTESVFTDTPDINIANDEVRFMAPAYAPYILDISEEQQNNLAAALNTVDWTPFDVNEPFPDGEAYTMYVYNNGSPYSLTLYGDNTVKLEGRGETTRWNVPAETVQAITEAACPSADGDTISRHLTWCDDDSININDIWKNTRVGAKQCDMTDKKDIFFKMNNTLDYFDRASGIVKTGGLDYYDSGNVGSATIYDFQVDLNMAKAYQHEENYKGTSYESFISGDGLTDDMIGFINAQDGENMYTFWLSDKTFYTMPGVKHRIDSPTVPFEELRCLNDECNDYDYWNSRTQLLGGITVECIENYRMAVNYLGDLDNWDIIGTEEVNGRLCVHINGVCNIDYEKSKSFDLYIDEETGVTVRMLGYDTEGRIVSFIEVEDLKFNDEAEPVKTPNFTGMTDGNYYPPDYDKIDNGNETADNAPVTEIPVDNN